MEYYHNGNDLIIGDRSGAVEVFPNSFYNKDDANRWERYVKGPIIKVGVVNKRIVYIISDRFDDAAIFEGMLEVLYGAANKTVDRSIIKNSKAHFKKPEFCVGLIKGVNDQLSKCMTVTPELLLTGGKNGRVILLIAEFKNPKFGADKVSHRFKQGQGEIGKV
ncbi:hypothetical protein CAEBREN_18632 [Caenorhabditis brenneri]|uniref:Uncharacterized protein n=1 Tax=Caenorhabditis brenneri TaxID=135651 RepID=G0NNV1_CAEBE|nr:hypothetical protein CAEBREN_18632 [Caenorhabditis brenneri]